MKIQPHDAGAHQRIEKFETRTTDWQNLANRREIIKELTEENNTLKGKLETAKNFRQDGDEQLIKVIEQQKKAAKDLAEAKETNVKLIEELNQLHASNTEYMSLDRQLQETTPQLRGDGDSNCSDEGCRRGIVENKEICPGFVERGLSSSECPSAIGALDQFDFTPRLFEAGSSTTEGVRKQVI